MLTYSQMAGFDLGVGDQRLVERIVFFIRDGQLRFNDAAGQAAFLRSAPA
jgi:hypothetical protein